MDSDLKWITSRYNNFSKKSSCVKPVSLFNKYTLCKNCINPLNAKLNPICYLLALLAHHILHISRIRVKAIRKATCNLVMKPFWSTKFAALRNVFLRLCRRNNCDVWGCHCKGHDIVTFLKGLSGYFSV